MVTDGATRGAVMRRDDPRYVSMAGANMDPIEALRSKQPPL